MARVVVLTPNPAVDVTYEVAEQKLGETVRVSAVTRRAGGKGLNVVGVLRQLGVTAVALQPLGGSAGHWIGETLVAAGVDAVVVPAPSETRTTVAVIDGRSHPTLYAEPGESLPGATWQELASAVSRLCEPGGFLVVSGSFPPGTEAAQVAAVVTAGRDAGALAVVDTSGAALLAATDAGADIVKPNEAEAMDATATDTVDDAAAALLAGGAGRVVISRGAEGLVAFDPGGTRRRQPAVPGVAGNPTGAGDAATAGLVAALYSGHPIEEALRWASVVGAAAVLAPVAGSIDVTDLPLLTDRLPAGDRPILPSPTPTR